MPAPYSSCIEMLYAKNINFDMTKSKLKGASVMMSGSVQHIDGLKDSMYCVIPQQSVSMLNNDGSCTFRKTDFASGAILNTHTLKKTSEGVLPFDPTQHQPILASGSAIYPTNGCVKDMSNVVQADNFFADFGHILDNQARAYSRSLDSTLATLINENANLDSQITTETANLDSKKKTLEKEEGNCNTYKNALDQWRNSVADMQTRCKTKRDEIAAIEQKRANDAVFLKPKALIDAPVTNTYQQKYETNHTTSFPKNINYNLSTVKYTISFWVKQTNVNPNWRNLVYFGFGDNGWRQPDRTPGVWIYPSGRSLHFRHSSTRDWNDGLDINQGYMPFNAWYHVVYIVNGNNMRGFINGNQLVNYTLPAPHKFIWGSQNKSMRIFSNEWGWPTDGGLQVQRVIMIPDDIQQNPTEYSIDKLYNDLNVVK